MRRTALVCTALTAALFAAFILRWGGSIAGGADTSGYLNSARLILEGKTMEEARQVPGLEPAVLTTWERTPLGYWPGQSDGWIVPIYPVGFPLHIALASLVTGLDRAVIVVNLLAWLGAVVLLWILGRELGLSEPWRAAAVLLFAVYPITVLHYKRVMSDGLAATWSLAAVVLAIKADRHRMIAVLAGFSLGVAVLVRPTSLLLLPAVVLAQRWQWRPLAFTALGAAPPALLLGWYNWTLYGKIFTTGYGNISSVFSPGNVGPCALHFAEWLGRLSSPAFLVLLVGGLIAAIRGDRRQRLLLTWAAAIVVFYLTYEPSLQGWWRLRFLLPAFPAMLMSAMLVARESSAELRRRFGRRKWHGYATAAILAGLMIWSVSSSVYYVVTRELWTKGRGEADYPAAVAWAEAQVEPDAVILCMQASGAMTFYGHLPIVRYDYLFEESGARLLEGAAKGEINLYALLFNVDVKPFEKRYGTGWTEIGNLGQARLRRAPDEDGSRGVLESGRQNEEEDPEGSTWRG